MPLTIANLFASEYLLAQQDNKDNFRYENVRTTPWAAAPFRARFKDILFSSSGLWNASYAPIVGVSSGGPNTISPYTAANDTWIVALDSTEKGLLFHTSVGGSNFFLWDALDVANFAAAPPNTLFPSATSFANRLGDATVPPGWLGNPYYLMAEDTYRTPFNFGNISRSAFSSVKVTLAWTGTPSITDLDANLNLSLWSPSSGLITAANVGIFGGSASSGVDSLTGPSERIFGAGAVEYYRQLYVPGTAFPWWNNNIIVAVSGSLGSVPVATGQDFSIFITARPTVGQGHGWGDVHLMSYDGNVFDLQSFGKVIYTKSLTDDFQVQTDQKPWYPGAQVSVNRAVAVRFNNQTYIYDSELAVDQELKVNGLTQTLASGGLATFGATRIQRSGNQYVITSAGPDANFATGEDNDVVTLVDNGSYVDALIKPSDLRAGSLQGLLGDGDGNLSNDFAKRDGTILNPNLSVAEIHTTFVDEWRVRAGESLFGDVTIIADSLAVGAIVVPVPEPEIPTGFTSLEELAAKDSQAVERAFALARQMGIPEGAFLEGAVFDVLVTGDEAFLNGAKQVADLAQRNPLGNATAPDVTKAQQDAALLNAPLGSIEGSKWNDVNGNGLWDTGEAGLQGWTVYIDSVNNNRWDPWETKATTDASGKYKFDNLGPGNYSIREVNKVGWLQTAPTAPHDFFLGVGQSATDINFGNYQLPVLDLTPSRQLVVEGLISSQSVSYTVTLSNPSLQTVTVSYATADVSATAGRDYTAVAGSVSFSPGVTSRVISIPILNDAIIEADETFTLSLSAPTPNATLGTQTIVTTTISDTLVTSATMTLPANVENLSLTGTNAINGTGNTDNNVITGNDANNILNGAAGNDRLDGAAGNDSLNGGAGLDSITGGSGNDLLIFQFTQSPVATPDLITDFAIGTDKIDLLSAAGAAVAAPASFSRAADSAAVTLSAAVTAAFADANGALVGNQALAVNGAALLRVTTAAIAGTYILVNDNVAGFQSANDLLINITGFSGSLPAFGTIPVSTVFI